jgi:cell division septation protein DedD
VTELAHHDADDGFHEIQLSGKQLVFAFMLTATVAVFIFLLGVQVGRNAKTSARVDDAPEAAVSGPPAQTPLPLTPPPPAAAPVTEGAAPATDLSYAERLSATQPVKDKLKTQADADSEPASSAPARSAVATPAPVTADPAPAPKEGAKATPKTPPVADHPAPEKPAAASGARPGVWVVQLVALKDRAAAAAVVQRLSAKGYPAFVVSPAAGKPSIYRVQVGRYNDRHEAEQIARRLEKEEQFKPWISH